MRVRPQPQPTAPAAAGARAGKVHIIAVAGVQRAPQLPDVPTLPEQGLEMDATVRLGYGIADMPQR